MSRSTRHGTLTEGAPRLVQVRRLRQTAVGDTEVLALAAAAENPSEHPLARAIVEAANEAGLTLRPAEEFASTPGRSVQARVGDTLVEVGKPTPVGEDPDVQAIVDDLEQSGHTAVVVRADATVIGVLGLTDRARPCAADTVTALSALTGAPPIVLTGDNPRAATALAASLGITEIRAGLLPQDKVDAVRDLQAHGAKVMLVGDGVNDAPAMAAATIGVAMGRAGSDLALDTADAVITRDDLTAIPAVIALARRARRLVIANLVIAATFITALVAWDLIGHLPLPLGVAGHEGSTIIVGLNGLRLLRSTAWPTQSRS